MTSSVHVEPPDFLYGRAVLMGNGRVTFVTRGPRCWCSLPMAMIERQFSIGDGPQVDWMCPAHGNEGAETWTATSPDGVFTTFWSGVEGVPVEES